MKNWKLVAVCFSLAIVFFHFPQEVQAHVLKTDGNIGAILHIDPEDDPIAGQQASFFFEFKDKQNKFKPEDCDCVFTIAEGGKQIFSQPLFQNGASQDTASVFFTFPQKDVYQVTVSGKPQTPGVFQTFKLVFDVRVARTVAGVQPSGSSSAGSESENSSWLSTHVPHLIAGVIIAAFFILAVLKKFRGGGNNKT